MSSLKNYNPHIAGAAVSLLSQYYQRTGNGQKVRQVSADYDDLSRNFQLVEIERGVADIDDRFSSHELSAEDLAPFLEFLRTKSVVKQVYVVQKACQHYPEWPHYYIVVKIKFPALSLETDHAKQTLINEVLNAAQFDGSMLLHTRDHAPKLCMQKIEALPDALVYEGE